MTNIIWTPEKLQEESLKYKTRTEFYKNSKWAYERAHKLGIFEEICSHMPKPGLLSARIKWTFEKIKQEALKYSSRIDFKTKSTQAYAAAIRNEFLDQVCSHMKELIHFWTKEEILAESLKYNHRLEFQIKNRGAYGAATRMGILDEACSHMQRPDPKPRSLKWTIEKLQEEAFKYDSRVDFLTYNPSAYSTCSGRGILDKICSHMKRNATTSIYEREILEIIKKIFPSAKTLKKRKIKIENRPYIHGFDIDIFVPELNLGIEFDGIYYHSFEGLKRARSHWPDSAIRDYHQIKDRYFSSIGIKILHIKEEDWKKDKEECIRLCLEFLENSL